MDNEAQGHATSTANKPHLTPPAPKGNERRTTTQDASQGLTVVSARYPHWSLPRHWLFVSASANPAACRVSRASRASSVPPVLHTAVHRVWDHNRHSRTTDHNPGTTRLSFSTSVGNPVESHVCSSPQGYAHMWRNPRIRAIPAQHGRMTGCPPPSRSLSPPCGQRTARTRLGIIPRTGTRPRGREDHRLRTTRPTVVHTLGTTLWTRVQASTPSHHACSGRTGHHACPPAAPAAVRALRQAAPSSRPDRTRRHNESWAGPPHAIPPSWTWS